MKHRFLLAALMVAFSLCAIPLFAEGNTYEINNLIQGGLDKNYNLIQSKSKNLTEEQRYMIINQNKKDAILPFAINFFVGCGVGSFVQKDITGGMIGLGGNLLGMGLYVAGYFMSVENVMNGESISFSPVFYVGIGVLVASRIFDLVRPFVYVSSYNDKLKEAISSYETTNVSFQPFMNIAKNSSNQYGIKATMIF